jgi:hypothetical protein
MNLSLPWQPTVAQIRDEAVMMSEGEPSPSLPDVDTGLNRRGCPLCAGMGATVRHFLARAHSGVTNLNGVKMSSSTCRTGWLHDFESDRINGDQSPSGSVVCPNSIR